ncbi:MAG: ABC transporter ATP-binding protein [Lachnospiraceae bacterium]|nr:ABC transporter ATP-binding protein [Lachnospiraceae bacterium]
MGQHRVSDGRITIGGVPVSQIPEKERMSHMMYIGHDSYLFKGTVRDNLLMGKPDASDEELWEALRKVRLDAFLQEEKGLSSELTEKASNLSGGQRQRLALARALLCDSDVYIFDEATSNVDAESEDAIIAQIYELSETKTVLMISHRLANVTKAGRIYVLGQGRIVQSGTHESLLAEGSVYQKLWNAQQELEQYGKGGAQA